MSGRGTKKGSGGTPDLLADLRGQVALLESDLRARVSVEGSGKDGKLPAEADLRKEHDEAYAAGRTAATYESWLDGQIAQSAVAWVLGCVFVRFAEDNELIDWPFLAGRGERVTIAEDRHGEYFAEHPEKNDRDWLIAAFDHFAAQSDAAAELFNREHNPLWRVTPSFEAATDLIKFWRRRGPDGDVVHTFVSGGNDEDGDAGLLDTRFLGDVYQDLSEYARKTYALLQTPEFVEEFILDLTLEPAVEEFELEGLRTIDPACGSGHFLLGMFHRLLTKWQEQEPATDRAELIRRALGSVHGCDKNPFAVAIARFRLHIAALNAAGATKLAEDHGFRPIVAVGDSLLHGKDSAGEQDALFGADGEAVQRAAHSYATEDAAEFVEKFDLLTRGTYHVVVANPPYIVVQDKAENANYRAAYGEVCKGKYSLAAPFAQRLFQLAVHGGGLREGSGYVGQITANSFMKREFGKPLIEKYFAQKVELSHIIDTSGAYIPGHGTPTVILIGRNHMPDKLKPIRAVLGVRGEPGAPEDPAKGLVWTAIVDQLGKAGSASEWVSVEDSPRERFEEYPWSVGGGGAGELFQRVEGALHQKLGTITAHMGFVAITAEDEAFFLDVATVRRLAIESGRPMVTGDGVRDYHVTVDTISAWPYGETLAVRSLDDLPAFHRFVWPRRRVLQRRKRFGKLIEDINTLSWYEYGELYREKLKAPLTIMFAFVATHNHFVLDRGGKVFNRSAPVIKLPEGTSEEEHLALLSVLNSSTACFWLKQVSQPKAGTSNSSGGGDRWSPEPWYERYEFTGTKLQEFPLPAELPLAYGRALDQLAEQLTTFEPSHVCSAPLPTRAALDAAHADHDRTRAQMIALQEELDWYIYGTYHLLTAKELAATTVANFEDVSELTLGERAFEIVLARKMADDEASTQWFARHNSAPITELPAHWPADYRAVVESRIALIESRSDLALIERPECKRRWATTPWDKKEADALRSWLLDRTESADLWYALREGFRQPRPLTINQLADRLRADDDFTSVASLYAAHLGNPDMPLERVLADILDAEHVPYLAALRYKEAGLRKRAQWERTWELQREEDRTGKRRDIPVPPKYTSADFVKQSYWSNRGKLDVPKERFIGYPGASPDADPTLLLGWAGWDHKDQAQALVNLVNDRSAQLAWGADKIAPLLAGLAEILPWIKQWHGQYDEEWGGVPAEDFEAFLNERRSRFGVGQ
ncbi:BREX-2 system adenine-specific DNA-methyltransferase PglX [Actinospica sp. MGRD01-02]|uniref:site-specific DNA-methyltransferase (adenine-specific) n=1 Tax=Actinospica acidithermotolerans TaxID=2828514 RepID=A0A941E8K0_9ACTN|nr:BREX-2 system adenine-specific DNA-methyltransferase PglX [Actinospica acidithermotolerans]MBR7825772.1 BREX-2 system adenine-specific DNA-methyltransferase PglX [Actinospica acidithermotolerans]